MTSGLIESVYRDGNTALPDSLHVVMLFGLSKTFDAWVNSADNNCAVINTDYLVFGDLFGNLDGAAALGHYVLNIDAYDADSTLFTAYKFSFEAGTTFDPANDNVKLPDSTLGDVSYIANNSAAYQATLVTPTDTNQSGDDLVTLTDIKYWIGLYLTMWPGCKAYYDVSANYDDIHLVDTLGDTIVTQRWHHVGGAAGDTPDTVRGIAP